MFLDKCPPKALTHGRHFIHRCHWHWWGAKSPQYETEGKLRHKPKFILQISWHYPFHMPYWKWVSLQESDPRKKKWVQPAKWFELQKQYTPLEDIWDILTFVKFTSAYNIDVVNRTKHANIRVLTKKSKNMFLPLFFLHFSFCCSISAEQKALQSVHWYLKKKNFSSYMRKFRMEQLQSHI